VLVFGRTRLTFDILPVLHLIRKTLNWSNPRGAWAAFDRDQGRVEEHKKTGSAGSLSVRYRSDPGMESQAATCGSVGYRGLRRSSVMGDRRARFDAFQDRETRSGKP
jgi:hypothetical protein